MCVIFEFVYVFGAAHSRDTYAYGKEPSRLARNQLGHIKFDGNLSRRRRRRRQQRVSRVAFAVLVQLESNGRTNSLAHTSHRMQENTRTHITYGKRRHNTHTELLQQRQLRGAPLRLYVIVDAAAAAAQTLTLYIVVYTIIMYILRLCTRCELRHVCRRCVCVCVVGVFIIYMCVLRASGQSSADLGRSSTTNTSSLIDMQAHRPTRPMARAPNTHNHYVSPLLE